LVGGDGVVLGTSRTWPVAAVTTRRGAQMILLGRAAAAGFRVFAMACVVAFLAYVIAAVDIALVTG